MLTDAFLSYIREQVDHQMQQLDDYECSSPLYILEARFTLLHAKSIFKQVNHSALPRMIENLLKARWDRIQNTNIQYLHDLTNPANQLCLELAKELERLLQKPYLTLVMPSLSEVPETDYITGPYTEALNLQDVVLSDDNMRLIHIPDVFDFAVEDAVLKHNSIFSGRQRRLSSSEQARVLSRHPAVKEAYDALTQRRAYKIYGETVGAEITRLIEGLFAGGAEQNGSEWNSGMDANVAIVAFNEYLISLSEETKHSLMNKCFSERLTGLPVTFENLWNRLTQPSTRHPGQRLDTIYCVEEIAKDLKGLLEENPSLYDLISYEGSARGDLQQLNREVEESMQAMKNALPMIERHPCYKKEGEVNLSHCLLSRLKSAPTLQLQGQDIQFLTQMHASNPEFADDCAHILKRICRDYRAKKIHEAVSMMPTEIQEHFYELTHFNKKDAIVTGPTLFAGKRRAETELNPEVARSKSARYNSRL